MDGKNSFILYCDIGQHLELLSDEDAGLLFKGIVHYADTGEPPQLPPMAAMAFSFIRAQIDRDQEKWNTTREKRRAAGKSGGLRVANLDSAVMKQKKQMLQIRSKTKPMKLIM